MVVLRGGGAAKAEASTRLAQQYKLSRDMLLAVLSLQIHR